MKLYYSPTSPYVRKVMMVAIETDLLKRIEPIPTDVWSPDTTMGQVNPLGKVPTLEDDNGQLWFDSGLICQYLAGGYPQIFPEDPARYWRALQWQVLADGICNAAVARVLENKRATPFQPWLDRQQTTIVRTLDYFETEVSKEEEEFSIGSASLLIALGYLDFRFADLKWANGRPRLSGWFERHSQRPSFQQTRPPTV